MFHGFGNDVRFFLKKSRFLQNLLLAVNGSDEFQGLNHVLGRCKTVVREIMCTALVASIAVLLGIFCEKPLKIYVIPNDAYKINTS